MFQNSILLIVFFLFISCGGGSHEPREEKTLYFIDSPVNGMDYRCGERQGVSKSNESSHGVITCVYAPLYLHLGKLELGMVERFVDGQKIYPQTLVPSFDGNFNNAKVLKIAILLQSLDDKTSEEYINIPKSIKDKISITSLDNLSIEELYEKIREMGITPVNKEVARVHLILNSDNVHSGKPSIESFEEDISISLTVGSIIGKISIDKGDGTIISPLVLNGEGKEYFSLSKNGSLKLIKSLDYPKTYILNITASNEFGYTTKKLIIHVKESEKIGKAQMGRLSDATVKIFKLNEDGTKELITTVQTTSTGSLNQIGNFELKPELLEDHKFYIYEVIEGVDIDSNDDGIKDKEPIQNRGKLRLITKGIWVKNLMNKIRVTPLSEMLYTYIDGYCHYDKIEERLDEYAQILLNKSLDSDNDIDAKDIMIFNPLKDKKHLYPTITYHNTYETLVDGIRKNNKSYRKTLFNAYIVESFKSTAIEIVGSYIYTIDMLESGEFRIYDLETKELIGSLKLPYTPYDKDTHVLYINLKDNDIMISSLEEWSYYINIKNQKNPILLENPFIQNSMLSGNFNQMAIGKSNNQNIFSQERALYFYDISLYDEGQTKKIQFFNINENDDLLQYEFDSQLLNINSLWSYKNYLYVVGDNKIHIFSEKNNRMRLDSIYNTIETKGNILGIEKDILYILDKKELTLIDVSSHANPQFLENISVPFSYKLGVKTNGEYITTGSQIIDIKTLRATSIQNAKSSHYEE